MKHNRISILDVGIWLAGLAILVGCVLVVLDPQQRVGLIRNEERILVLDEFSNALLKDGYKPKFEGLIDICTDNFCDNLLTKGLLSKKPLDPTGGTEFDSGYRMEKIDNGIKLFAPHAEEGAKIERIVEF